jgi:hypothetical protein
MTLMNYDPLATRGAPPFETCDNTLQLAEHLGVGARNPKNIEVRGAPIKTSQFDFLALRKARTS